MSIHQESKSIVKAVILAGLAVISLLPVAPQRAAAQKNSLSGRRGAMVGGVNADGLNALADRGANLVRWQINPDNPNLPDAPVPTQKADFDAYMRQYLFNLNQNIEYLNSLKPVFEQRGLAVVVDLHTPPFRRIPNKGTAVFYDARVLKAFYDVWDKLILAFKNNPTVVAFDLINEPYIQNRRMVLIDWNTLVFNTASRIRKAHARQVIVVESELADPAHFDRLRALPNDADPVVYSFHYYTPGPFVFQGMADAQGNIRYPKSLNYPGKVNGIRWDRQQIKIALQPVRDFQKELRAQGHDDSVFVGEFAVSPFAPPDSAGRWLDDCISLFEGWHFAWTYHAWREANVWNIEMINDPDTGAPYNYPARLEAVQRGWRLNSNR